MIVYKDFQYGMNAIQKLIYWVGAWVEGEGSAPYNVLVNHFATQGVNLTPEIMSNIVGADSMLGYISTNIYVTLLNDMSYGEKGLVLNNWRLTQVQWGSCAILGSINNTISTIPPIMSLGDFDLDSLFTTQPEYGIYVYLNNGTADDLLSPTTSKLLLMNDTQSYRTLLNPDNMRVFYEYFQEEDYTALATRFNVTQRQANMLKAYLEQMIDDFIMFGGPSYEPTALGIVTAKAINSSYAILENDLPIDVTTRNLASWMNQNGYTCASYINLAVTDQTQAA